MSHIMMSILNISKIDLMEWQGKHDEKEIYFM